MGKLNKKTGKKPNTAHHGSPDINLSKVSARRYQDLFNNASDAIFIRDLKGNTIEVNEAAVTLTGYTHNELTRMNVSEFLTAESFKETMKKQKALLEDETAPQRYELEIIRKDGVRLSAESRTSLLTHDRWPIGVQCIVRDITEQKQIEKILQASEERFRNIYEESPIGIELYDCDGRLLTVNRACLDIFGVSNIAEVQGFKLFDDPNVTDEIKQRLCKMETVRYEAPFDFEKVKKHKLYNTSKSGTIHLNVLITPLGARREKRLGGYLVQIQDITERKRAEQELRNSYEYLEKLNNSLEEVIFNVRLPERVIEYVNHSVSAVFGYKAEVCVGKTTKFLYPDEEGYLNFGNKLNAAIEEGEEALHTEHLLKSKSGEAFPAEITTTFFKESGKVTHVISIVRDITERKRVEEKLRIAEQNYRNSLDSSPLGIRIVTAEGELLYANQAILDIYGYSSVEELKNTSTKQRYTPKSYAEHQIRKDKRKQGKPVPSNYEVSIVRKDGEVRHLAVFRKEVIWGGEIQFQALYQDITERKLIAEKLRRFKTISDRAGYGAGIITPEGNLTYVNESFAGMHGYTIEELTGKNLSILHTKEQMRLVERLRKKLIQAGSYFAEEVWHKKKNGTVFPTLMTGTAIKDDMGKSLYLSATAIDITEQKQVETALRQSEEFNSSLLTNSPSPILVLNADASIRYVNPALEKLTGFSSAELVGRKPPFPWWIEETRKESSRELEKAMHRGARKYDQLFRRKNGEHLWVGIAFKTIKVAGECKYHLANWGDLTEQKRLRGNMEFYISQITRAQEEERKRIAREVHDELIQSLASLALEIDAITQKKERLPEDVVQRIKGVRAKTNIVLDSLRRFSHDLRPGVIDQVGLVPGLEILAEELNKVGGINASLQITGPETRLRPETELALFRITQEALRNARRHSGATDVMIKLRFTHNKVRLSISDNGRGFKLPRMLGDFATGNKLGIIGMQERARLVNGKFLVKSHIGKGTTVIVVVEL